MCLPGLVLEVGQCKGGPFKQRHLDNVAVARAFYIVVKYVTPPAGIYNSSPRVEDN